MKVCFLVGSLAISGGTYVILQHAAHLRRLGHAVTLAVQEAFTADTLSWHDAAKELKCVAFADGQKDSYDVVIATWWKTALELPSFKAAHHAYFVQSIESRFYPAIERPLRRLVDRTYELPVHYATEATWIKAHLQSHFGQQAALVRNGIRKDIYTVDGPAISPRPLTGQPRVLIEGHFGVSFKNTALAVRLARRAGAKDIWLLTGSNVRWIPGVKRLFSKLPMTKTPEVYRSCDILVKLSTVEGMFGPPLEMFHCGGTALVFDVSGHDEYIRHDLNAVVVNTGDTAAVVDGVRSLLNDRPNLRRLQSGALQTAAMWPSWPQASQAFQRWIEDQVVGSESDIPECSRMIAAAWAEYGESERERLAHSPSVRLRYRVSKYLAQLPRRVQTLLQQGRMVWEVVGARERVG